MDASQINLVMNVVEILMVGFFLILYMESRALIAQIYVKTVALAEMKVTFENLAETVRMRVEILETIRKLIIAEEGGNSD